MTMLDIIHRPVLYLKHKDSGLNSVFLFMWKILSWTKSIELVSVCGRRQDPVSVKLCFK
jgi:hypothetical protein